MKTPSTTVAIELDEDRPADIVETAVIDETAPTAVEGEVIDEDVDLDRLPDMAVVNDDGTVTLTLLYPQPLTTRKDGKVRERQFDTLHFHRLNGANQRAIGAAREDMMTVVAFAQSTKISQAVMNVLFDKMDAADIQNAGQVLNYFLSSGRKTGRRG